MEEKIRIRDFFDKRVNKFDSIYDPKKKFLWMILDFFFRSSMQKRFTLALEELKDLPGKSVLDIGCGSGRYSIVLAKKGARVMGVDFADNMVGLAKSFAKTRGVENLCSFLAADFIEYKFNQRFNFSLAIGFFDYIKEPIKYLEKIKVLTIEKAIMSFPSRWHLRNIIRFIRLKFLSCPVYFYSKSDIEKLLLKSGFDNFEIKNIGRDFFVVVNL